MKKIYKKDGFTLVELMVSVGLTAILMVGVATFFSSTFRNMFVAREKVANTQEQFVVNTILGGKFVNVAMLQDISPDGFYTVLRNDMSSGDLPFTYIGTDNLDGTGHIVFKDFFVFNGKEGSVSSQLYSTDIDNPGGITLIEAEPDYYYVTAPLEDTIHKCLLTGGCTDLVIEDLDHPMGITDNGTDTLYVTDAGNNRIVKIENLDTTKDVTKVADGFNYPTGIEYYIGPAPTSTEYLFVSDTYNHLVKKITLPGPDPAVVTVVGDGDDESCDPLLDGRDHTALYCKLNFPTGLMIHNDELYISDTGNGRVLKVSDPGKPSDFTMEFLSPSLDEAIKEIKMVFPSGTIHSGTTLDSVTSSDLDEDGNISNSSETFVYELWTTLNQNTTMTNDQPDPTPDTLNVIRVSNGALFDVNDALILSNDANNDFEVDSKLSATRMRLKTDFNSHHNSGEEVILTTLVAADTSITFDLSGVATTSASAGFSIINIEMYDETDGLLETRQHFVRIGNGELGTPEDTIEVLPGSYDFPTGLGWFAGLDISDLPLYSTTNFPNYDYISEFDVQDFEFDELNGGKILELYFEAELGKDDVGDPIWEEYTLNADISP